METKYAAAIALICVLLFAWQCDRESVTENYDGFSAPLEITVNDKGNVEAKRQSIQVSDRKTLKKVQGLTGTDVRLQQSLGKRNTLGAISHDTKTTINVSGLLKYDSARSDYYFDTITKWYDMSLRLDKKAFDASVVLRNKYDYRFDRKKSLFGPDTVFVWVENLNPYTTTTDLSGGQYISRPSRFGVGPVVGYGFNEQLGTGFFVGVGVQYSFVRF